MCHESATSRHQSAARTPFEDSNIKRASTKGLVAHTVVHAHRQPSSGDVDIHGLHAVWHLGNRDRVEFEIWIAWWRVLAMVFQTVQVLVAFAADLTAVRLLLFHTDGTGVGDGRGRVHN